MLTPDEIGYFIGDRIGKHWPARPAFLDLQYAESDLTDDGVERLFQIARSRNPNLIPVATADTLHNPSYRRLLGNTSPKLGVYVAYDEVDADILAEGVKSIGCHMAECVLFVDFTGADLEPERAAGSVSAIFDLLGQTGQWQKIVFQGSAFPIINPAENGQNFLVPRNEWTVFHAAMKECLIEPSRIGYGDYCADCGEINFPRGKGGGKAIRHLRYTTETDTLVVRGSKAGGDKEVMRDVCMRILKSGYFAGRSFSYADDIIWCLANGHRTCGNASMWREWNTTHHVMHVMRALGKIAGVKFADANVSEVPEQFNMFEH